MTDNNGKSAAQQLIQTVRVLSDQVSQFEDRVGNLEINHEVFIDFQDRVMENTFAAQKRNDEHDSARMMRSNRVLRSRAVRQSLASFEALMGAVQDVTDECPCGKHKGIIFTTTQGDDTIVLEKNMCPLSWWRKQHQVAVKRKDKSFLKNNPLKTYLEWYTL